MNRWLEITTVLGCKNLCDYCPQPLLVKRYGQHPRRLSLDAFRMCLSSVPIAVDIHFSGYAEPWLNPECTDMLLYAAGKGHRISIYTTLVGMERQDVERIRHVPFQTFLVHLPDADGLMKVVVDSKYCDILSAVHEATLSGLAYRTIGRQSVRISELIGPQPVEAIDGAFVHSRAGNVDSDVVAHPVRHTGRIACSKGRTSKNVLLPNGDVTLCCMDYGLEHILGNLLSEDYASLHAGREYHRVIKSMNETGGDTESLCRRCEWAAPI